MEKILSKQHIRLILLLFTTFLPSTPKFNIIKILIVFALYLSSFSEKSSTETAKSGKRIIVLWLLSIFIASATVNAFESAINLVWIEHEVLRVIYYGLVIMVCSKIEVDLPFLFYCCVIVLSLHFIVQLTQYFRLGTFDYYIENYYLLGNTDTIHYQVTMQDWYTFRSGSIFINPNVYVCYPYLSLGVFLEYGRRYKSPIPFIMIAVAFISIIFTGSRMGMGSFIFILLWFYFLRKRDQYDTSGSNVKMYVVLISLLVLLLMNFDKFESSNLLRSFNFDDAIDNSGSTKFNGIMTYLSFCNPAYWLTGSLGSYILNIQIDMELGYIFAWFGILGMVWYIKLIRTIYLNNANEFRVISTIAMLAVLLTAIGASSILNMSVFPYICAISLTKITNV